MSDKIEEPKKCGVHTDVFLQPAAYNPAIFICPKCREERYAKAVVTRKKNEKTMQSKIKGPVDKLPAKITLDFTLYTGIRDELLKSASVNFRTIENEIIYSLNEYLTTKKQEKKNAGRP